MNNLNINSGISAFNSPIEVALRLLFIFNNTKKSFDIQRLIYYNYLLIHSSDVPNAPASIHADLPRRSCEMLVNRKVIQKALTILLSRGLIDVVYLKKGIEYKKNNYTEIFTTYFDSTYSKQLQERSQWLGAEFDKLDDKQLSKLMDSNLGKWGSEFSVIYTDLDDVYA
jgi:hypothetical protein